MYLKNTATALFLVISGRTALASIGNGCPDEYDSNAIYEANESVSVRDDGISIIYTCKPFPESQWCSDDTYSPMSTQKLCNGDVCWPQAWNKVGPCEGTFTPTGSPTFDPANVNACPKGFEIGTAYEEGDEISVTPAGEDYGKIYKCKAWPLGKFCVKDIYSPANTQKQCNGEVCWPEAWTYEGSCSATITPTFDAANVSLSGCPKEFESDTAYEEGDVISVTPAGEDYGKIYKCKPWPEGEFCVKDIYSPSNTQKQCNGEVCWPEAWTYEGSCYGTMSPTDAPTQLQLQFNSDTAKKLCQFKKLVETASNGEYVVLQAESWVWSGTTVSTGAGGTPLRLYTAGDLVRNGRDAQKCSTYPNSGYCVSYSPYDQDSSYYNQDLSSKAWNTVTCEDVVSAGDVNGDEDEFNPATGGPVFASNGDMVVNADGYCLNDAINHEDYFKPGVEGCSEFEPSMEPSLTPSMQPSKSAQPSSEPSDVPSFVPSSQPSGEPSSEPSGVPSFVPSSQPSGEPSSEPSGVPSFVPSSQPSGEPSSQPSGEPSSEPSGVPSFVPSSDPSSQPSLHPSFSTNPTSEPSLTPSQSSEPSSAPSNEPSSDPSSQPSLHPSFSTNPTSEPSLTPSQSGEPSSTPSNEPSLEPTNLPTSRPTPVPTSRPTSNPTPVPTSRPTSKPTPVPTSRPTSKPTQPACSQSGLVGDLGLGPAKDYCYFVNGLCWLWASPCSGSCSQLNALSSYDSFCPAGLRYSTQAEFDAAKPTLNANKDAFHNKCAAGPVDPKYNHCDKSNTLVRVEDNSYNELVLVCGCAATNPPTSNPTSRPTSKPTSNPTSRPTSKPTSNPTSRPTPKPTASKKRCINIRTGSNSIDGGNISVSIDKGDGNGYVGVINGSYSTNAVVLNQCYSGIVGVQVRGPTTNGWAGSIKTTGAGGGGSYSPMRCTSGCTPGAGLTPISVDGNDSAFGTPVACVNGETCTLVPTN